MGLYCGSTGTLAVIGRKKAVTLLREAVSDPPGCKPTPGVSSDGIFWRMWAGDRSRCVPLPNIIFPPLVVPCGKLCRGHFMESLLLKSLYQFL